ncbi:MAG: hypothetical protein CMP10_18620 [Zetaproteobacteria bacterium]|nr:hypothetical protein [Pseudobdellovibrionaceae bacterium]
MKFILTCMIFFSGISYGQSFESKRNKFVQQVMYKLNEVRKISNNNMKDKRYDRSMKLLMNAWDCADFARNERQLKVCKVKYARIRYPK